MKKVFNVLSVLTLSFIVLFTACNKNDNMLDKQVNSSNEISLKSLEPDVIVKGTGEIEDYEKVIVEDLVKKEQCKWEVVSGIVEFYYENEMVFAIDFGNNECDGVATVSWLDENYVLQSKVVDVWKLFKKGDKKFQCFELLYTQTYTMPDGSTFTVENKNNWTDLKEWYAEYPGNNDVKPTLNYPVNIKYKDGNIVTINSEEEMIAAKKDCDKE